MDYNNTSKEKHHSAAAILAIKLKQENKLSAKLKPHFKSVSKKVKGHYAANGKLPSLDFHKKAVKEIINNHYLDTAALLSSTIRDGFQPVKNNAKVQAIIDGNLEIYADDQSDKASDQIASTTQDDLKRYAKDALVAAAAADIALSDSDVADEIAGRFDDVSDGRIDLISITETGVAASDGLSEERDALIDADAEFDDGTVMSDYEPTKTWMAILDDHTREDHADADGQEVAEDEPFEVGGEELMEPMDDSLGASPENIINCRCSSVTSLAYSSGS